MKLRNELKHPWLAYITAVISLFAAAGSCCAQDRVPPPPPRIELPGTPVTGSGRLVPPPPSNPRVPLLAGVEQRDEYWPFSPAPKYLWASAMDVRRGVKVFDNVPIVFPHADYKAAEPVLIEAVNIVNGSNPQDIHTATDIVDALASLGALHYQMLSYVDAEQNFEQALSRQLALTGPEYHKAITLYECLAMVYRAENKWDDADRVYQIVRQTRSKLYGENSPEAAAGYMNLVALYGDEGERTAEWPNGQNELPRVVRSDRYKSAEDAARRIMGERGFINGREFVNLSSDGGPRPIPPSPMYGIGRSSADQQRWEPKSVVPDLVSSAHGVINHYEELAKQRQQAEELRKQEEARRRKEAFEKQQRLIAMKKPHKPSSEDDDVNEYAPGDYKIEGLAFIASDAAPNINVSTEGDTGKQQTKMSAEKQDKDKAKRLPLTNIYLCKPRLRDALATVILKKMQDEGIPLGEFGTKWPFASAEAQLLLQDLTAKALRFKLNRPGSTAIVNEDNCEYYITNVPKGSYVIFARYASDRQVMYWLLPINTGRSGRKTERLDIVIDNVSRVIWREARELQTHQEH
jgi:tetratricopeptide (TPR) repeat protein